MKFFVLSRDFRDGSFELFNFEAEDEDLAWENVEATISTNNSQEWLMTEAELKNLKEVLK